VAGALDPSVISLNSNTSSSFSPSSSLTESNSSVMVMRSPCAGDALDPPLWENPDNALSLSLSLENKAQMSLLLAAQVLTSDSGSQPKTKALTSFLYFTLYCKERRKMPQPPNSAPA
jgi:hypothetical protein